MGAVASHCFPHPTLSLASEQTLKDPRGPNMEVRRALLILQPFRHFICITAHSPSLLSLYLRHSTLSNPSIASPMSQLIRQPFFCFSYITGSSLMSPGELHMFSRAFQYLELQYIKGLKDVQFSRWSMPITY